MSAVRPARLLLADDHAMVRRGLRLVLDAEPDLKVVAEAGDGAEALDVARRTELDLAVLDVSMPRMTGLQAAGEMIALRPELRVLMLSMHGGRGRPPTRRWVLGPMAPALPATHHGRVPRLLVFWTRPQHLSAEDADAWTCEQLSGLQDLEAVERARLTRLGTPSTAHPQEWDWMLELDLAPGADARRCVESGWCGQWLADLQLLGMRPAAVLADDGRALPAEDG